MGSWHGPLAIPAGARLMADTHTHFGIQVTRDLYRGMVRYAGAFAGIAKVIETGGPDRDLAEGKFFELRAQFRNAFDVDVDAEFQEGVMRLLANRPDDRAQDATADDLLGRIGAGVVALAEKSRGSFDVAPSVRLEPGDLPKQAELDAFRSAARTVAAAAMDPAVGMDGVVTSVARAMVAARVLTAYGVPEESGAEAMLQAPHSGWALGFGPPPLSEYADVPVGSAVMHQARVRVARDLAAHDPSGTEPGAKQTALTDAVLAAERLRHASTQQLDVLTEIAVDVVDAKGVLPRGASIAPSGAVAKATGVIAHQFYIAHCGYPVERAGVTDRETVGPHEAPRAGRESERIGTEAYVAGPLRAEVMDPRRAKPVVRATADGVADPLPYLEAAVSAVALDRAYQEAGAGERRAMGTYARIQNGEQPSKYERNFMVRRGREMLTRAKTHVSSLASTTARALGRASGTGLFAVGVAMRATKLD
ncbi:MAG: hypothetical protein HOV68_32145, partial [Streptomycetaceae bacterium]|nr:hypothetical protein [Streptomycetaceae bacterium]